MADQQQFLNVIDRDEAERRFRAAVDAKPLGTETVSLADALGRVLAEDVVSSVDVPSFDRSNYDGFAVRARDTFEAREEDPCVLTLLPEVVRTAVEPQSVVEPGTAVTIATGAMVPRGADAVVMVEDTDLQEDRLLVRRAVTSGYGIASAGTDIAAGELVLRKGQWLTSRETGVLAAIGKNRITVHRKPRVAVIATGDEIIEPGRPMSPGHVYDSNSRILADAIREAGGIPVLMGIVPDDFAALQNKLDEALACTDMVLLSGGTSKGEGDLSYQAVRRLTDPGIVAHGVALKPGKPLCLGATGGKGVVVLPGFPTSAIFTFHEFIAPMIRAMAGLPEQRSGTVPARLAVKVVSEIGRTEYLLVGLLPICDGPKAGSPADAPSLAAYPMGKGSGSVTTFSCADGFVTVQRHEELLEAGASVEVTLLGRDLVLADLVVLGSHCVGLDFLLGRLHDQGWRCKFMAIGSQGGLDAARRGECDVAGIHLLDEATGQYNRPYLDERLVLVPGYRRKQGIVFRRGDDRFEGKTVREIVEHVANDASCLMVNRNRGSGTRILIDQLLNGRQPPGYATQPRSHSAVAAAVRQRRADWGVAIEFVAKQASLGFLALTEEQYDFVIPRARRDRPAVQAFCRLLTDESVCARLAEYGLKTR